MKKMLYRVDIDVNLKTVKRETFRTAKEAWSYWKKETGKVGRNAEVVLMNLKYDDTSRIYKIGSLFIIYSGDLKTILK